MAAYLRQTSGMESRDFDVGAAFLIPATRPLIAHPGDHPVEPVAVEVQWRIFPTQIDRLAHHLPARTSQVKRAPSPQQGRRRTRPIHVEHRLRRECQAPLGRVAAEARLPECGRAARRVATANILRLDQHDPPRWRQPGPKARPRDPPPDDKYVRFDHHGSVVTV